jgi:glycosyltransferase involved in cell wall biosynthesis
MTTVTIGMPLYNNSETLCAALDSLLAQTVQDIRIVLSDDRSSDDTGAICEAYARRDRRVEYTRQPVNLGYQNFKYVLDRSDTPFFMWAAGDDRWEPTFIERNLRVLRSDASICASVSKVCFEKARNPVSLSRGTYALIGSVAENIAAYLSAPSDNSRMYGVFRTEILKASFPQRSFHAYDWALSAATLRHGKHHEVPEVLMFRDWTPPRRYSDLVRNDHGSPLHRLFPVLDMSRWLLFEAKIPLTWRIGCALLALNIDKHFEYCEKFHPRYITMTSLIQKLWRDRLRWRLVSRC